MREHIVSGGGYEQTENAKVEAGLNLRFAESGTKREKFNREYNIRKIINHDSIRKLERAFIKRSLKLKRVGHFYLERVKCNLRESFLYTTLYPLNSITYTQN